MYCCSLFSLLTAFPVFAAADIQGQLIEWLHSNGGYFNPKQELRYGDGLFGVFAANNIHKYEVLAQIPWDCVIAAEDTVYRFDDCETVELLAEELKREDMSGYAKSLKDAAAQHSSLLPTNWSPQGQELLRKVIDNGALPPHDVFMNDFEWKRECEKVDKDATLLVMTHGEDIGMVPITDKYNSRGGNWTGAFFSIVGADELALEIRACCSIRRGEQIYTNYWDYGLVGTPELLRDYGFVESYPQRYIFHDQKIAFDINEVEQGNLQVMWLLDIFEEECKIPNDKEVKFLEDQVKRLKSFCPEVQRISKETNVPKNELQVINQFCSDFMTAMSVALQNAMPSNTCNY